MKSKLIFNILGLTLVMLFTATCVPQKKFDQLNAENEKHINQLFECEKNRSKLMDENNTLNYEKNKLNADYLSTTAILNKMQNDFDSLLSTSSSQAGILNNALKIKSEELRHKENLLSEREAKLFELQSFIRKQDSIINSLNTMVVNTLKGFNADELSVEQRNGRVYISMSDKLLFKSGSAMVEEKGKQALKKLAEVMNRNPDIGIQIEGHTDSLPINTARYKDNWDLSVDRAVNITRILTREYKVNPRSVTASGRAEFQPKGNNQSTEGRAQNRRTEIILIPNLDVLYNFIQSNQSVRK
jgi:chemotaxis protein MotB